MEILEINSSTKLKVCVAKIILNALNELFSGKVKLGEADGESRLYNDLQMTLIEELPVQNQ